MSKVKSHHVLSEDPRPKSMPPTTETQRPGPCPKKCRRSATTWRPGHSGRNIPKRSSKDMCEASVTKSPMKKTFLLMSFDVATACYWQIVQTIPTCIAANRLVNVAFLLFFCYVSWLLTVGSQAQDLTRQLAVLLYEKNRRSNANLAASRLTFFKLTQVGAEGLSFVTSLSKHAKIQQKPEPCLFHPRYIPKFCGNWLDLKQFVLQADEEDDWPLSSVQEIVDQNVALRKALRQLEARQGIRSRRPGEGGRVDKDGLNLKSVGVVKHIVKQGIYNKDHVKNEKTKTKSVWIKLKFRKMIPNWSNVYLN